MRTFTVIFYLLFVAIDSQGQNDLGKSDDASRIVLSTYLPEQVEGLTEPARAVLENKLTQITTKAGMGGATSNSRFIITANVYVLSKEITPTAPPMHSYNLEIALYIGDGVDGTKFSSSTISVKGVGETETKAYIAALKNIKPVDPIYQDVLMKGKSRIIEFYNSKCDFILSEAKALENQNEFDAAIAKLSGVPDVCKDCYDKALAATKGVFKAKIDRECKLLISQANAAWAANQDLGGANTAGEYLGMVEPMSSCYDEVKTLTATIAKRILELDKREWNFKLKQQQDAVDLDKALIKAARDVGVAYGQNQPKVVYNIRGWY